MPKSPNTVHDRIGRMVAQKDEMERKVRKLVDIQSRERHWIQNILSHLKKADERAVIQMRYIDSESWSNVSRMLFGAKDDYEEKQESYLRRTTKLHGRALVSMAKWASVYPEDYPAEGAEITIQGVFGTYEEDGGTYWSLTGARFI